MGEGAGALVAHARILRFPAKPSEFYLASAMILDPCRTPGNAVAIVVIWVGVGQNIGLGNGLDQAKPKGRHGNAR
ncbi:hypothetical protein D3C72_1837570 [compost metagenome]